MEEELQRVNTVNSSRGIAINLKIDSCTKRKAYFCRTIYTNTSNSKLPIIASKANSSFSELNIESMLRSPMLSKEK